MAAGPFGFDLDLAYRHGQGSGNTVPEMQEIMNGAQARQLKAAQLQQEQYQQQRERSLSQLVSQNANAYADPTARAYALGGFGEQAQAAQAQAFQRQQMQAQIAYQQQERQMQLQESAAKLDNIHRDLTASRLAAVKSQDDFDKIASNVPDEYGLKAGDTNWQDAVKTFRQSRITPEQEAQNRAAEMRWGRYVPVKNQDGLVQFVNPTDPTDTVDIHQSETKLGARGAKGAAAGQPGLNTKEEGVWQRAERMINPNTAPGELGASAKRVNAAQRVLALVDDGNGGVRNLDKREVTELATSLQSLLSPGGHSQAEVEHLVPKTWEGNVQGFLEQLSADPTGLNMQKFVEKMKHTVERERAVSQQAMKDAQYSVLPGAYGGLYKSNPARARAAFIAHGIDPSQLDENLGRKPSAATPAAPAFTHMRTDPDTGETRGWDGKQWVPVKAGG